VLTVGASAHCSVHAVVSTSSPRSGSPGAAVARRCAHNSSISVSAAALPNPAQSTPRQTRIFGAAPRPPVGGRGPGALVRAGSAASASNVTTRADALVGGGAGGDATTARGTGTGGSAVGLGAGAGGVELVAAFLARICAKSAAPPVAGGGAGFGAGAGGGGA